MATSGHGRSEGASVVTTGNGSPCRQAVTPLKPRNGATTCVTSRGSGEGEALLVSPTCSLSSALWHWALLTLELWWWGLCFASPTASGVCPTAATSQEGCNTSFQPGNWFGGASIFVHFSHGTQGSVDSLGGLLMGAATSSGWTSEVVSQNIYGNGGLAPEEPLQ